MPRLASIAGILAVPAAVAAYIAISGLTGSCPNCTAIVDRVRGAPPAARAPAPVLAAHTLAGDPREIALASGGTGPTLIDIWGTRCAPCLEQRRVLGSLAAQRPDLRIISLATDLDPRAVARTVAQHPGAGEELLADARTIAALVPPSSGDPSGAPALELPTLIIVDAAGTIRTRLSGLRSLDELRAALASAR